MIYRLHKSYDIAHDWSRAERVASDVSARLVKILLRAGVDARFVIRQLGKDGVLKILGKPRGDTGNGLFIEAIECFSRVR